MAKTEKTKCFRVYITIYEEDRVEQRGQVLSCQRTEYCSTAFGGRETVTEAVKQYNEAAAAIRELRLD